MSRHQQQKHVLGSDAVITIIDVDNNLDTIFKKLWQYIREFETRFSRFVTGSELNKLNQKAGQKVKCSDEFLELASLSNFYSQLTQHRFTPFVLPSLQQAGYKGSWPKVNDYSNDLDYSERQFDSTATIKIESKSATIPANTAIDFGGIGKGFCLQKIADKLQAYGLKNYWISLGGDIICSGYDLGGNFWEIDIASATKVDKNVGSVINYDGQKLAVATSGTTKRAAKNWHHIIDPTTGKASTSNALMSTAVCQQPVAADVLAKTLIIEPGFIASGGWSYIGQIIQTVGGAVTINQKGANISGL